MKYVITEKAKESPRLITLQTTGESVGVGGKYMVKTGRTCPSCTAKERAIFEKEMDGKPQRFFREALPHEYEQICEQYAATGGIPGLLIIVPDEPKPEYRARAKEKEVIEEETEE